MRNEAGKSEEEDTIAEQGIKRLFLKSAIRKAAKMLPCLLCEYRVYFLDHAAVLGLKASLLQRGPKGESSKDAR
eukprot:scaffold385_cov305-Pinguiococcus_pyrenoidosus.AAC.43